MTKDNPIPLVKEQLQGDLEMIKQLHNEIENATNNLVPVLRIYVDNIRGIRMSIVSEVREILRSSRELGELTKSTPALGELATTIERLKKALDDGWIERLRKIL